MQRTLYALMAVATIALMSGCHTGQIRQGVPVCDGPGGCAAVSGCETCGQPDCTGCQGGGRFFGGKLGCRGCGGCGLLGGWFGGCGRGQDQGSPEVAGPPTGQVTYPYYTPRGPRDFFVNNPPSIGR